MVSGPTQEWALVLYNVSAPGGLRSLLWHQRRILGEVAPLAGIDHSHVYAVLTPDNDVYLEDFGGRLRGITAVRFAGARRSLPGGVPAASTYRFTEDVAEADLVAAQALAVGAAEDWWTAQGGPQPATFLLPVGEVPPSRPPRTAPASSSPPAPPPVAPSGRAAPRSTVAATTRT